MRKATIAAVVMAEASTPMLAKQAANRKRPMYAPHVAPASTPPMKSIQCISARKNKIQTRMSAPRHSQPSGFHFARRPRQTSQAQADDRVQGPEHEVQESAPTHRARRNGEGQVLEAVGRPHVHQCRRQREGDERHGRHVLGQDDLQFGERLGEQHFNGARAPLLAEGAHRHGRHQEEEDPGAMKKRAEVSVAAIEQVAWEDPQEEPREQQEDRDDDVADERTEEAPGSLRMSASMLARAKIAGAASPRCAVAC